MRRIKVINFAIKLQLIAIKVLKNTLKLLIKNNMKKKSANTRLDFARQNNQYAATALLNDDKIRNSIKKASVIQDVQPLKPIMPSHEEPAKDAACICNRKSQVVECQKCKMLFYGRVSQKCFHHPNVTYLLDFFYCPSCTGPKENLKVKSL